LGKYEDFVLTALSLQGNNALFIDKSQSERKDILSQFIGVDIFDKLYNVASDHNKETSTLIRRFKNDDFTANLLKLNEALETITEEYRIISEELSGLECEEEELNDGIIENTSKLVTLASSIRGLDEIESDKHSSEKQLEVLTEASSSLSEKLGKYTTLKSDIDNLVETHFSDITIHHNEYNKLLNSKREITHSMEKLELRQKSLDKSLLHLSEHEYNPDCSICLKNSESVIKNKENVQSELSDVNLEIGKNSALLNSLEGEISELSWVVKRWDEYTSTMEKKRKLDSAISDTERELTSTDGNVFRVKTKLERLEEELSDYYRFETDYKTNLTLNKIIGELKSKLNIVRSKISDTDKRLLGKNGEQSSVQKEIQLLTDKIEEVRKLEAEHKSYEYYLDAVKRDGISYELISKIIPIIEGEVNNILAQMVEFGMQLEMDGKNINAYIVYADQQWPLEMSSGMERFISGLAIRVALINVCNLPRPNFLVVDEGFGSLDSENMTSMFMMFNYLKTQFDFVMVISHIDSMRDIVDQLIEIKKTNGFSYLKF
jgi:DNA repair exonuclease SbcCD ATPase subunit